jgi:hypothetical protein
MEPVGLMIARGCAGAIAKLTLWLRLMDKAQCLKRIFDEEKKEKKKEPLVRKPLCLMFFLF